VRYETDIPRQVGLGGSSALIAATLRALMAHYGVTLSLSELATLALEAETEELRIAAGLQDRVVQAYGGLVYMDFDRSTVEASGRGRYERLDPARLPRLYVAYRKELSKVSGHVLSELGARFARGDETVIRTLGEIAQLAQAGREALLRGAVPEFARLMDENFDLRRRIVPVSEENLALVEAGRRAGACAKFAGSGGSIVGVVEDDAMLVRLTEALGGIGATLIEVEVGREEVQA
jgi:glucuronokinase